VRSPEGWVEEIMKFHLSLLGMAAMAGTCGHAMAQSYYTQDYNQPRRLQWHVEAGYSITTDQTARYLDNGWTIGTGFTWHPDPRGPFALRTDLNYSRYNATNQLIALANQTSQTQIDDGSGHVLGLDVNGVYEVPFSPWVRGYLTAGVGVAYRRIELTQTVAVGTYFCDPWWGFCGPGYIAGDHVVAHEETTRFAWNGGVGLDFALGGGQSWFIEARYSRMETQQPTTFLPIRVGFRF
jgi:opacity protein-like surface antigen